LSVTTCGHLEKLKADVERYAETLRQQDCVLVVGGRSARTLNLTSDARLFIGRSMSELEAFARGLALASNAERTA
jgi:hypothetical protein